MSCKKQGPPGDDGPVGPTGPVPAGTITGKVTQFDEFGTELKTGLNTVTVSIQGTNLNAVTDENGTYVLPSVQPGIHVLGFRGPKTQVCQNDQVTCTGSGTLHIDATLYNKPTWTFSDLKVDGSLSSGYFEISATITPTLPTPPNGIPIYRYFIIIFSDKSTLSNSDPSSYDAYRVFAGPVGSFVASQMPAYPAGTTFFAKLYSVTSFNSWYLDSKTKKPLYYSVGDTPPQIFTLKKPNF